MSIYLSSILNDNNSDQLKKYINKLKLKILLFLITIIIFAFCYSNINTNEDWNITIEGQEMTLRNAFHFSIVTIATVGYGDIYPISTRARLLAYLEIFIGFIIAII